MTMTVLIILTPSELPVLMLSPIIKMRNQDIQVKWAPAISYTQ